MNKRNTITQSRNRAVNRAVRYVLVAGATVAAGHAAAAAQLGNSSTNNTPANLGKVTVTGTRIKRTDIETAQPITRISRQQIQRSGYTNVGQLLGQLSQAGSFINSSFNNGGSGQTYINLRNLGRNRNLVLVDGKRWLPTLGGSTNLNTIPTSIIDHIDILQDGASAIYGSDAITGVINFVTVKNFNGAEAHAHYGIHEADDQGGVWDGQEKQYDFTVGAGNDRGNVTFNATYREQNPIKAGRRDIAKVPHAGEPGTVGGSSGTPKGRFITLPGASGGGCPGSASLTSYGSCDLTLKDSVVPTMNPTAGNFRNFDHPYNFAPANYLQVPNKDVSVYVQGHYDLFDNVTFTANAEYVRDEATQSLAPEPLNFGFISGTTNSGAPIDIAANQKYNPLGVKLAGGSSEPCLDAGTCDGLVFLDRRMIEAGPRVSDFNRDNFHIFAGFNGYVNLFNREVDWDVGFAQNRVQSATLQTGSFNTARIAKALGPAAQCTSPCVPLNLFGGSVVGDGGSITQDQLGYIGFEAHNITQTNLRDWTANLSSDLIELPAGPLGLAVGYERIDAYGYFHPDALVAEGNTTGNANSPTNGRNVRNAEYAELNIPLLSDLPGVQDLSVDIANRWTQFKFSGGIEGQNATSYTHNSSGRLNIRYQPINDLLLRATWAQAFRAPSISALFSGQADSFAPIADPCAGGGALPGNCPNGTPDTQPNSQILTTVGGNPNQKPESAISRTVGFVYSPSQVPGLDIQADYFKIELSNALSGINGIGAQNILNGCFFNGTFCNLIQTSNNIVKRVVNIETNIGGFLTEGIDVGLHYKFPTTPLGDFDARINGTFTKVFDQTEINTSTSTGFATSHLAGAETGTGGYPKRKFNGYLDWDYGNWSAQYHIEFIDGLVEQCNVDTRLCGSSLANVTTNFQGAGGVFGDGRNRLGATVYHDVNISYAAPVINTTFTVGVQNLFDKNPPISHTGQISASSDLSTYRLPSRLIYGDIRVRF